MCGEAQGLGDRTPAKRGGRVAKLMAAENGEKRGIQ